MSYDFDIENYNEEELLDVLGIGAPIEDVTEEEVISCISNKTKTITTSKKTDPDIDQLIGFFNNAGTKLLSYIVRRNPVQLPPTNYNIIQSQNQLSGENHAVTTDKIIPPVNVSEYKYPVGVLNPIEKRTVTKIINIDSVFRENYATTRSNNFSWVLSSPENKVVSMKLVSVELPVMWYDITDKNNCNEFTVTIFNAKKYGNKKIEHLIKVPPGNYNNPDMENVINRLFQNKRKGLEYLIFEIDENTSLSRIRSIDFTDDDAEDEITVPKVYDPGDVENYSPDFYFTIEFYKPGLTQNKSDIRNNELRFRKSLGWYLGFRKQSYEVRKTDTFTETVKIVSGEHLYQGVLLSESSFGGGRSHYIYISIDDFNRNCLTETISSQCGDVIVGNNILGRISLDVPNQDVLINQPSDRVFKQRDYLGPVTLHKFRIGLLNRFGDLIDLKNNDFSLALELTILY